MAYMYHIHQLWLRPCYFSVVDTGRVYSFGNGSNGQLGHGTLCLQSSKPVQLGLPKSMKVKSAACGNSHTALVTGESPSLFDTYIV